MALLRCECKAVLTQRGDSRLELAEPVEVEDVKVESKDNKLVLTFQLKLEDKPGALEEAEERVKELVKHFSDMLLLKYNVAGYVEDVFCETCIKVESGRGVALHLQERITVTIETSISIKPSKEAIKDFIKIAKRTYEEGRLDDETRKFFEQYREGLVEDNRKDKFTKWWTAFEIWYTSKGYKKVRKEPQKEDRREVSEAKAAIKALQEICGVDAERAKDVYRLRSALFHEGVERIEEISLKEALCILSRCLDKVREELWKELSHGGS